MLTQHSFHQLTAHIAGAGTAMAGATIAASAALACSLGEACVRLNISLLGEAATAPIVGRLAAIRDQLQTLTDEDGAAITGLETLRDTEAVQQAHDRLCHMPLEMGTLTAEAADLLQGFRPFVQGVQDDLEMAITLLAGAAHAATLLLDSNLRLWPEPALLAGYEPELAGLRARAAAVQPAKRVRP